MADEITEAHALHAGATILQAAANPTAQQQLQLSETSMPKGRGPQKTALKSEKVVLPDGKVLYKRSKDQLEIYKLKIREVR